jgi:hypothetical protein
MKEIIKMIRNQSSLKIGSILFHIKHILSRKSLIEFQ